MANIINTVFPVYQGFDSLPAEVKPPFSPGPGINEFQPVTDAGNNAPGFGLAIEVKASNLTLRP